MKQTSLLIGLLAGGVLTGAWGAADSSAKPSELSLGIQAYQQQRWTEAMGHFVRALNHDPASEDAHAYLNLLIKKIESDQEEQVRERRLLVLGDTAKRLEANHMDSWVIDQSLVENVKTESEHKTAQWHGQCTMAQIEDRMGHLATANDLVLQVIAQDPNNAEAQRMLSDLQSQMHEKLNASGNLSDVERTVLEGFYAYGQADYRLAHTAWVKTRAAVEKVFPPEDRARETAALHFEAYDKVAQAHVDEADRVAHEQALFNEGVALYQKGSYAEALDRFRQVALGNADYPQLAMFLVQSEAAVEKDRTSRISREKLNKAAEAFAVGVAELEKGRYADARRAFQAVLAQDPSHPQARSYLSVVETEMNRRHDPHAAELHYEAGVISYAAGKFEEAVREWSIAARLDPRNQRAANALSKVQKELAAAREIPG